MTKSSGRTRTRTTKRVTEGVIPCLFVVMAGCTSLLDYDEVEFDEGDAGAGAAGSAGASAGGTSGNTGGSGGTATGGSGGGTGGSSGASGSAGSTGGSGGTGGSTGGTGGSSGASGSAGSTGGTGGSTGGTGGSTGGTGGSTGGTGGSTGGTGGSTGGTGGSTGGTGGSTGGGCDDGPGKEIVDLLNDYRASEGLDPIPCSPSLMFVAETHVHDLHDNQPHAPADCNLHSWSDQGSWSACCYTADHAEAQCMWDKPRELTVYTGSGYENAASGASTPESAISMWKNSSAHNAVMLNQGMWSSHPWHAVGAALYQGYAVLWFGEQTDPG